MDPFRIVIFFVACALAWKSFDSWRAAFTGTQPKVGYPMDNPKSLAAFWHNSFLGFVTGLISLGFLIKSIFWGSL
jgi:hypothetical protein